MMIERIQSIKEQYYKWISTFILVFIIIGLGLSSVYPPLKNTLVNTGAIQVLILTFLLDSTNYLIKINKRSEENEKVKIYYNQDKANNDVFNYIIKNKPKKADLIEYSSHMASDILYKLRENNCKIRLLIAHPDIALSDNQKHRICNRIESLVEIDFHDYENIEIKCYDKYIFKNIEYKVFPSLRARKLDDKFICFSWYTPTKKIEGGIMGHNNPMICAYTDNNEGKILCDSFDDLFNLLWSNGTPIIEVYKKCIKNCSSQQPQTHEPLSSSNKAPVSNVGNLPSSLKQPIDDDFGV